jgi:hypothetical protein
LENSGINPVRILFLWLDEKAKFTKGRWKLEKNRGLLVASHGQFSGITVVYLAAEDKPKSSSVEGVHGSLVRCPPAVLGSGSN